MQVLIIVTVYNDEYHIELTYHEYKHAKELSQEFPDQGVLYSNPVYHSHPVCSNSGARL